MKQSDIRTNKSENAIRRHKFSIDLKRGVCYVVLIMQQTY